MGWKRLVHAAGHAAPYNQLNHPPLHPTPHTSRPPGLHTISSPRLEEVHAALQLRLDGVELVHCGLHLVMQLCREAARGRSQVGRFRVDGVQQAHAGLHQEESQLHQHQLTLVISVSSANWKNRARVR